jgi:hypothetical protein
MNKYESPCRTGECEFLSAVRTDNSLCNNMAGILVEAGAAGVFEATPCPFEVAQLIASAEDEQSAELREKLGIIGLTQGGEI